MKPGIIIAFLLLALSKASFAQEIIFTPRENIILVTLSQIQAHQAKEEAIGEAMQEAQMKIIESRPAVEASQKIKGQGFSFQGLASRAHPYLNSSARYDDSMGTAADRKSSIIYATTPGLQMSFRGKGQSLSLNTRINNTRYSNRSRNNRQDASANILDTFNLGRFTLSLSDNYYSNYVSGRKFGGVEDDNFDNYWSNTFVSTLGRHFNRIGFDIGYTRAENYYQPEFKIENNSVSESFTINTDLKIATKTLLSAGYAHSIVNYTLKPDPNNSTGNNFSLSLKGVLSPKINSSTRINYALSDNKTGADGRSTTLATDISYQTSVRTNFSLSYSYSVQESSTKSDYSIGNSLSLSGNHRLAFNPKFNLSLSASLSDSDSPKQLTKRTRSYVWSSGLTYAFRQWLDFALNYTRTRSSSNLDNNSVTLSTQARF